MDIIPAIDLLNGCCVRLRQGDYNAVSSYDDDPAAVARRFFVAGTRRLHVVDLDAARSGQPVNHAAIREILAVADEYQATVEVGGGLRTAQAVADILAAGAAYAIIGTAAVKDAALRRTLIADYPGQIIVGVDVKAGYVAVAGWCEDGRIGEADFLAELHDTPPAAIIYTDISRDGMLTGNNVAATTAAAAAAPCPLIASGGIGKLDDVRALITAGNIAGVVIGQAIYTGNLDLSEALQLQQ
ncbi:MAG: 1-(5-phosphoribosyl)-5-((5-phosphoribosylamino)methylideneamino)imidazole-4-carboxamide isomerase [Proteobacteria bacterium]|nr:1-(5-phosphoribosyl)-5-((5-phosphoribosylamino)methylideneamino)imidazole-4-carboxamide isomerase [Pseudomonadota bacterium]